MPLQTPTGGKLEKYFVTHEPSNALFGVNFLFTRLRPKVERNLQIFTQSSSHISLSSSL